MKKIYFTLQMLFIVSISFAQNWTNVGSPNFSNGTTLSSFLYFGDMEIDANGNVFVGYWDYGGKINFAKNSGSGWTILPSPGTCAVGADDIEIFGTDYYFSYLGARGANYYAFVKKYNGTSWAFVGDSILIGGVGQGGSFDFLLDNSGVPTIIGLPKTIFGNKTVKQFKGGAWITTCVIPNSTAAIFKDGSAIFDANNKLCCIIGGSIMLSGPPYSKSYCTGVSITDSITTNLGDTIFVGPANGQFRNDNAGNSYLLFNDGVKSLFLSYKLNGNKWNMIADTVNYTASAIGSMLYTDVSNDGKVVFSSQTFTALHRSMFMYDAGKRSRMDSINLNGSILSAVSDVVIHNTDVYVLLYESGFTVMKHSLTGGTSSTQNLADLNQTIKVYPNPATDQIQIDINVKETAQIAISDINGKVLLEREITQNKNTLDISKLQQGIYFVSIKNSNEFITKKLLIN